MELAEDVRGSTGMVLLGSGAVISDRHIGIFKSWGVTQVDIKGAEKEAINAEKLAQLTDAERHTIDTELNRLFQRNDPLDPVIEELRRICLRRESERAAGLL
jgi:hypothetical protein